MLLSQHYRAAVWRSFLELEKKAVAGEYAELWCRVLVAYAPPEAIVRELQGEDDSMADAQSDCELELSSDAEEEFLTPRGSTVSLDSDIPDASAGSGGSMDRSWSNQFWYSVSLGSPRSPLDSPKVRSRHALPAHTHSPSMPPHTGGNFFPIPLRNQHLRISSVCGQAAGLCKQEPAARLAAQHRQQRGRPTGIPRRRGGQHAEAPLRLDPRDRARSGAHPPGPLVHAGPWQPLCSLPHFGDLLGEEPGGWLLSGHERACLHRAHGDAR
mmetsp:Transcript_29612/g.74489  ORF Transcript_29612/g.74489 Transcript_29612/m.74489 type:complete len:269 (-) Transcript_29612:99-905(-)